MGINFRVGLPGPFSYSKRISGRKSDPEASASKFVLFVVIFLFVLPIVTLGAVGVVIDLVVGGLILWGVIAGKMGKRREQKRLDEIGYSAYFDEQAAMVAALEADGKKSVSKMSASTVRLAHKNLIAKQKRKAKKE